MEADICLMVFQEANKIWMFGKKLWLGGLILKRSYILIANKNNQLKDFLAEVSPVVVQMTTNKQQ